MSRVPDWRLLSDSARVAIKVYFSGSDVLSPESVDIHLIDVFFFTGPRQFTSVNVLFYKHTAKFPSIHNKFSLVICTFTM